MATDPDLNASDYQLLSAYIDDALSESERERLEARLEQEPELRQELETLQETVNFVRKLPTLKAPRNFTLTEDMLVGEQSGARFTPKTINLFPVLSGLSAAAAFVLIALGLVILAGDFASERKMDAAQEPVPVAAQLTETATEQQATVTAGITATLAGSPTPVMEPRAFSPEVMEDETAAQFQGDTEGTPPAPDVEAEGLRAAPETTSIPSLEEAEEMAQDSTQDRAETAMQSEEMNAAGAAMADRPPMTPTATASASATSTTTPTLTAPTATVSRTEVAAADEIGDDAIETPQEAPTEPSDNTALALVLLGAGVVLLVIAGIIFRGYRRQNT